MKPRYSVILFYFIISKLALFRDVQMDFVSTQQVFLHAGKLPLLLSRPQADTKYCGNPNG